MNEIVKLGKPVVLMVSSGRPLDLSWEDNHMQAILANWFLGTRSGKALADILFGNTNPSGKLTMSFPRNVGQVPIFYAAKTTGRPFDENIKYTSKYLDVAHTPLYPFGYGLSYTTYEYSNLKLSSEQVKAGEKFQISITVKNTGSRAGYEIVQVYVQDLVGSNTRPAKELKRFAKIYLNPGESQTLQFELHTDELKYYNEQLEHLLEPGKFKVYVGKNSNDVLEAGFELK
jgi:beta-glucosidase